MAPANGNHALFFNDEARAIGSGLRLVSVRVGHKWVRVRCPYTNRTARFGRQAFEAIWSGTQRRMAKGQAIAAAD